MSAIQPIRAKWKGTMTDRERFHAQMHYQPVDRSFHWEFGYWDENFTQWKMFRENGITNNAEAERFFSFDRMETIGGNAWMAPPFPVETMGERDGRRIMRNEDGLLAEVPLDGHETIPHFLKASIETPDDWKRVKAERFRPEGRTVDIAALKARHPDDRDYPLGVWVGSLIGKIRDMLTFEGLCYAQFDYPAMLEDMVETCCVLAEQALDQLLPHFSFDFAAGWEDICFKNGPIVTPDFFHRVLMPRYQRLHKKLMQYGVDIWYMDCDGDIRPILDDFLEGGVNCLFPLEINGSGHPGELLQRYGRALRIMGGIDKMQLRAGRRAIDNYLDSVAPWVERGGFIPFCDHRCPPDVPSEDYLYYLDRKEQLFGRPFGG